MSDNMTEIATTTFRALNVGEDFRVQVDMLQEVETKTGRVCFTFYRMATWETRDAKPTVDFFFDRGQALQVFATVVKNAHTKMTVQ